MSNDRPHYLLRLVALPADAPAHVRLQRVMKALLRAYGFRCISAAEVTSEAPPAGPGVPPSREQHP
jgi:hypothetical protein